MLVMIKFKVKGEMRFLSHAETMRVFQRACARAGIRIKHSEGFNPHPRLSLVVPRSVGVESEDELLCFWLEEEIKTVDIESLKGELSKELPEGIEIAAAEISSRTKVPEAESATYSIKTKKGDERQFKERIDELLAKDKIIIGRHGEDISKSKEIDIRPFLESIKTENEEIVVECAINLSGTIRVNEILDLFQIKAEDLDCPVMRKHVRYNESTK
jgi:radical SAM-linked protein